MVRLCLFMLELCMRCSSFWSAIHLSRTHSSCKNTFVLKKENLDWNTFRSYKPVCCQKLGEGIVIQKLSSTILVYISSPLLYCKPSCSQCSAVCCQWTSSPSPLDLSAASNADNHNKTVDYLKKPLKPILKTALICGFLYESSALQFAVSQF